MTLIRTKKSARASFAFCVIKTALCCFAFFAATAFFFAVCRDLAHQYITILLPSVKVITLFIRLGVSVMLLTVTAGIMAVLVRPFWAALATYVLAGLLYPWLFEPSFGTWIVAGIFAISSFIFFFFIARSLQNQIHFSSHPIGNMKALLCATLAGLVSFSFALGYGADAGRRGFVFPPELKSAVTENIFSKIKAQIEIEAAPTAQKQAAMKAAHQKVQETVDGFEKQLKSYQHELPVFFAFLLFFVFQLVFLLVEWVAQIIFPIVFFILRVTHFAHLAVESQEVTRLTLK